MAHTRRMSVPRCRIASSHVARRWRAGCSQHMRCRRKVSISWVAQCPPEDLVPTVVSEAKEHGARYREGEELLHVTSIALRVALLCLLSIEADPHGRRWHGGPRREKSRIATTRIGGAMLQWGRDLAAEIHRAPAAKNQASMGPRRSRRGNSARSPVCRQYEALQWGRDDLAAGNEEVKAALAGREFLGQ